MVDVALLVEELWQEWCDYLLAYSVRVAGIIEVEASLYAQISEAEPVVLKADVQTPIFGKMAVVVDLAVE